MSDRRIFGLINGAVERLASSERSRLIEEAQSREKALIGIGVFEDPKTFRVMAHVQAHSAVSSWEIYVRDALSDTPMYPTFGEIESALSALADNGFVLKGDSQHGRLPLFSPTAKGVRVFKALSRI